MIHPTARRLDEPPLFAGLTILQWAGFILGGTAVGLLLHTLGVPTKPAATLWAFVVPLPVALARVAEPGRVRPGRMLLDCVRHLRAASVFAAGPGERNVGVLVDRKDPEHRPEFARDAGGVVIPWD